MNTQKPPTYAELAKLVVELTEINIANIDQPRTGAANAARAKRFVSCFTYRDIPEHWRRAIEAREALIANKLVKRRKARS